MQQQGPAPAIVDNIGNRSRTPGQTSATEERSPQRVAGTVLQFNLSEELATLRREKVLRRGEHNAKALVKEPDLRVVLIAIKGQTKLLVPFLLTLAWSAGDGARESAPSPKMEVASPTLDVR